METNIHFDHILLSSSWNEKYFRQSCRENQNTHLYSITFFLENLTVYEIMWKDIVEPDRPQMTIWLMRIACRVTKATNLHSEYVIVIAFPLQQLFHERASLSCYAYNAWFVLLYSRKYLTSACRNMCTRNFLRATAFFFYKKYRGLLLFP